MFVSKNIKARPGLYVLVKALGRILGEHKYTHTYIYEVIEGLYRDNGKENGNYHLGFRFWGQVRGKPRGAHYIGGDTANHPYSFSTVTYYLLIASASSLCPFWVDYQGP